VNKLICRFKSSRIHVILIDEIGCFELPTIVSYLSVQGFGGIILIINFRVDWLNLMMF
jgi:hypothetical protein